MANTSSLSWKILSYPSNCGEHKQQGQITTQTTRTNYYTNNKDKLLHKQQGQITTQTTRTNYFQSIFRTIRTYFQVRFFTENSATVAEQNKANDLSDQDLHSPLSDANLQSKSAANVSKIYLQVSSIMKSIWSAVEEITLSKTTNFYSSKLKEFADDKFKFNEMEESSLNG